MTRQVSANSGFAMNRDFFSKIENLREELTDSDSVYL